MATQQATAKYVRVAPNKVRQLTRLIVGAPVADADNMLAFSEKGAAKPLLKVLRSAVSNAEFNADPPMDLDSLYVERAWADEGPTLKRFRPRAMGRATRIRKRTSHITVVLSDDRTS
jgi:large subunit ribosomal protein L22